MSDNNTFIVLSKGPRDRVHHVYGGFNERWCGPSPVELHYPTVTSASFHGHQEESAEGILARSDICKKCQNGVAAWLRS